MRFMEASSLRLGDLLMFNKGATIKVTRLTWHNGEVLVNDAYSYQTDETVSVSSGPTFVPVDREVLWRQAVALQVLLDSAIVE